MSSKPSPKPEVQALLTGLAMGESPRWHENRLWFSDWGAQEIVAVDLDGKILEGSHHLLPARLIKIRRFFVVRSLLRPAASRISWCRDKSADYDHSG
jgi:hypothetical protein